MLEVLSYRTAISKADFIASFLNFPESDEASALYGGIEYSPNTEIRTFQKGQNWYVSEL